METGEDIFDRDAVIAFYKDVLNNLLPNARHQALRFFGAAEAKRASHIDLDLISTNELNRGSAYFYKKQYSFIHYTTLPVLLNIIKEKKIRLYNLNGMDDQEEFVVPLKHLNKKISDYEIDEIKKRIFCFSMCEADLESKEQTLPMWRSYAQDGQGVGVVFSMNKRFAKDWVHSMLSKVYYDPRHLQKFIKAQELYKSFTSKYNLHINNFDEMFYRYFAFHKNKIYSNEKEVRLIYCEGFGSLDLPNVHVDITKKNSKTTFVELDLEWEWGEEKRKWILSQKIEPKNVRPIIFMDKIFFGYRISNNAKYEIADVIMENAKNYKHKPKIVNSSLQEYFEFKK